MLHALTLWIHKDIFTFAGVSISSNTALYFIVTVTFQALFYQLKITRDESILVIHKFHLCVLCNIEFCGEYFFF